MNISKSQKFFKLLNIMDDLRESCPWDKKQTIESLSHLTIEETYELTEAINEKDYEAIKGELGDLLLHIVFYAKIASEKQQFDIYDVIDTIADKLIYRHPHVYGNVPLSTEEEVKNNWEKIKLKEGKQSVLEGVPRGLPAIIKALRIQEKVSGIGFDWENIDQVFDKIKEEIEEFQYEVKKRDKEKIEKEFGDILFSLINYSRHIGIDPERALELTNKKFIQRFINLEKIAQKRDKKVENLSVEEMNIIWEQAKKKLKNE